MYQQLKVSENTDEQEQQRITMLYHLQEKETKVR